MPEIIRTAHAPTPGNYNQAFKVDVGVGYLIYTAGQTGNLPPSLNQDEPVVSGGIGPQTTRTLMNLDEVLHAAGARLGNVIEANVFLEDLERDKPEFEKAYISYFAEQGVPKHKLPPRTTVGARVPLATEPTIVEIKFVAYLPK